MAASQDGVATSKCEPGMIEPRHAIVCISHEASSVFFFNDPAPTEIYTLSLRDALPIYGLERWVGVVGFAVFLTAMTAGRLLGTRVLDQRGRVPVLRVLFVSAVVGCLLVVYGGPVLAFVGAAIWGVGASLGFPVGMSAAADDPRRAAARMSV